MLNFLSKFLLQSKGEEMPFCKFSTEYKANQEIAIAKSFVTDYMPYAPESCTKVFLYGLAICTEQDDVTNNIENFSQALGVSKEDIKSSFLYWQEQGLVTVLNFDPIEVRYLNIVPKKYSAKLFKKERYADFNRAIQEVIDGRMITPHEYKEYYLLMESMHIEDGALIMIAKYCVSAKGGDVGYNYILTVAKNWAYQGIHTARDVETKLSEMEVLTSKVKDILVALKSKKEPCLDDKDKFTKWTKDYGYDVPTILKIAKSIKRGGIDKLDETLDNYFSLKLFSETEIENYESNKTELLETAKAVCKSLGLYYENLSPVINTYIIKWRQMGYSSQAILTIADLCFKKYIRTFEAMDEVIAKYYARGIVSIDALNEYISSTLSTDKLIKQILEKLNLSRQVTTWDRDYFHTWKTVWQMSDELINYATTLAVGKTEPMAYLNKILSNWKEQGISTIESAKQTKRDFPVQERQLDKPEFMTHSFSPAELNALFDNLDEVKLK